MQTFKGLGRLDCIGFTKKVLSVFLVLVLTVTFVPSASAKGIKQDRTTDAAVQEIFAPDTVGDIEQNDTQTVDSSDAATVGDVSNQGDVSPGAELQEPEKILPESDALTSTEDEGKQSINEDASAASLALSGTARAAELFQFQVTTTAAGQTFYVPTSGSSNTAGGTSAAWNKSYNWNIDWGDTSNGTFTQANSPNTSSSSGIPHLYTTAGTYTITITPNGSTDAWLGSFGFYTGTTGASSSSNTQKVVAVLSPLTLAMTRTSDQIANPSVTQPSFEWAYTFYNCSKLATMGSSFTFDSSWSTVTTVGSYFASYMFYCCSAASFTMNAIFNLPQNISTAGSYFVYGMFEECHGAAFTMNNIFNLPQNMTTAADNYAYYLFDSCYGAAFTMNSVFNLPQSITSVGVNFTAYMFQYCYGAAFTMNSVFNLPQGITSVGNNFANYMFGECSGSSFTMNSVFNLPQQLSTVGANFAEEMFQGCAGYSFTMNSIFNLPQNLTVVGNGFAESMFQECYGSSFTMNAIFNLPQGITTIGNFFANYMFSQCRGYSFTMNTVFNVPQGITTINSSFLYSIFYECSGANFQINDVFRFPRLSQAVLNSSLSFYYAFYGLNTTVQQKRSAVSIINNPSTVTPPTLFPITLRHAFDSSFRDYPLIHANWGGQGKASDCTITFNLNGYDSDFTFPINSQPGLQGSGIGSPVVQMTPGTALLGWFTDAACTNLWNFDTSKISAGTTALTLYAGVSVAPSITTTSLPGGVAGSAYSASLAATGSSPITWSLAAGSTLPPGLSLKASSGAISGTPTAAGNYTFTVVATNAAGSTSQVLTISVAAVPPAITTTSLGVATVNTSYSATLSATGTAPLAWSLASGSTLPEGLSLSLTGVIAGAPTAAGNYTFTVVATNAAGSTQKELSLRVIAPPAITTTSLSNATVNTSYSATLGATGTTPLTWSLASGSALPTGLSLGSATGIISGTPTLAGSYTFTVVATNEAGSIQQGLSLLVMAPPAITSTVLSHAIAGVDYSATVKATGTAPLTWSLASGSTLPLGFSLDPATGAIYGNSTVVGTYVLTVVVTNAAGFTQKDFSLRVDSAVIAPTIETGDQLSSALEGMAYSVDLEARGTAPITWSLAAGSALPDGLSLDAATGIISGAPTVNGDFSFVVVATNSENSDTKNFQLTIGTLSPTIPTTLLGDATINTSYSATLSATAAPPATWSLAAGSAMPAGLSLDAVTGIISGTPTVAGDFTFTVVATNSVGFAQQELSLRVMAPPVITTTSPLSKATINTSYSTTLSATGVPAATWSLAAGSALPDGLSLSSTGVISGTPTVSGDFTFTVLATNSVGSAQQEMSLRVLEPPSIEVLVWGDTAVNTPYEAILSATGTQPITWSLAAGSSLPAGLSLGADTGKITGTPTVAGVYDFTIVATNEAGSAQIDLGFAVMSAPVILTDSLNNAAVNTYYSATIDARAVPYIWWSLSPDSVLPPGLSFDEDTGVVSGTPTTVGDYAFTVGAGNEAGFTQKEIKLRVVVPPAITTTSLSNATVNTSYSATLSATGTAPLTWSLASGSTLPDGLSLSPTGIISGTPTGSGDFTFTVVADNGVTPAQQELSLRVMVPPTITTTSLSNATVNTSYSTTLSATGTTPLTWSLANGSALPPGLSLDPATGIISGAPTLAGGYTFTVVATNEAGSIQQGLSLLVMAPPVITTTVLSHAIAGVAYSATVKATGTAPITWSLAAGSTLPDGLALDSATGTISGTSTTVSIYSFTVVATNTAGSTQKDFTLTVDMAVIAPTIVTDNQLSSALDGVAYSVDLEASGTAPITWSLKAGSTLPAGLSLDPATGIISGTPTVHGDFSFTVIATNSENSDTKNFQLTIGTLSPTITTTSLSDATINTPYSATLSATAAPSATWSLAAGSTLPNGLSLDPSTGVISGTPTASGDFTFTVVATNLEGFVQQEMNLRIMAAPVITTASPLSNATINTSYSTTLTATGVPAATWSLAAGSVLPDGLSLSQAGAISGTPTVAGDFTFTVVATNSIGFSQKELSLRVLEPPSITTTSLSNAPINTSYSTTLSATGTTPLTWSLTAGSTLPDGLSLSSTGVISGTPTASGDFSFTVVATNEAGSVQQELSLLVMTPPVITTLSLDNAMIKTVYFIILQDTGTAPITWSLKGGSVLPEGLHLDSAAGIISGIPRSVGNFSFTLIATNAAGSSEKTFDLRVNSNVMVPNITTDTLANAVEDVFYQEMLAATGTEPIGWSLTGGALPDGLSLDHGAGIISGTPTAAGSFTFKVAASNTAGTSEVEFTLLVRTLPSIVTTSLNDAVVQAPYSVSLTATGSTPITWSLAAGSTLPDGLSLDAAMGIISGVPTTAGSFTFTVVASNAAGSSEKEFTLLVGTEVTPPTITTTSLSDAVKGASYSSALTAVGTAPLVWSLANGSTLPDGLSLDAQTGIIAGSPTATGTYPFTVSVSNDAGTNEKALTLRVTYAITGDFGTWSGKGSATAKIDAELSKFVELRLGDQVIDASLYTLASGSTLITFTEAYLSTLKNGVYDYTAVYVDGVATPITLVIDVEHNQGDNSDKNAVPALFKVGDDAGRLCMPLGIGILLSVSLLALIGFVRSRRMRLNRSKS